jgi:hypothetical protein
MSSRPDGLYKAFQDTLRYLPSPSLKTPKKKKEKNQKEKKEKNERKSLTSLTIREMQTKAALRNCLTFFFFLTSIKKDER